MTKSEVKSKEFDNYEKACIFRNKVEGLLIWYSYIKSKYWVWYFDYKEGGKE